MDKKLLVGTLVALIVGLVAGFYIGQSQTKSSVESPATTESQSSQTRNNDPVTSAKGVISVEKPAEGSEIGTPLLVIGSVKSNKGTVSIILSQKDSGVVVGTKEAKIDGVSDNIQFAEAILFGLPAIPQEGILEVSFKDESGSGADDSVSLNVNFPSDLGR